MPVVDRALNLLKISILMAKMGKPITPRLVFLKKSRKIKNLKLLKHYNYGFIREYEFSPSSTPLFRHKSPFKKRSRPDIYSMFSPCHCWGSLKVEGGEFEDEEEGVHYALEALPSIEDGDVTVKALSPELCDSSNEDYSVDQRAEMFIQRFYEEMRIQRQEAVLPLQLNA
ncbi:hypothetical protein FRX31_030722 [Thalictrum thalictroides]|uniref:Cotton fiber protein n=1 Tax=Thalictrum thalictroides TaxID=46969 RepID=A0A7J6V409_THATH|nr:hypothetical protein FRX31_030722 [Thalictrum thalictroides]